MLDAALSYLRRGWSVFPISRGTKIPPKGFTWKPYQTKQPTEEEIRGWIDQYPGMNLALATGAGSGVVVFDVDDPELAKEELAERPLPRTPTVRTTKGLHYYFKHPGDGATVQNRVKSKKGWPFNCSDLRGDGGYVLIPPSACDPSHPYEWVVSPEEAEVADLPEWLEGIVVEYSEEPYGGMSGLALPGGDELLLQPFTPASADAGVKGGSGGPPKPTVFANWEGADPDVVERENWYIGDLIRRGIPKGTRNDTMTRAVGRFFHQHMPLQDILPVAMMLNDRACKPPMDDDEVRKIVESISKRESQKRIAELVRGSSVLPSDDPVVVTAARETVLGTVSNMLKVRINRLVVYLDESGQRRYVLYTEKGQVSFPDAAGILFFGRAQVHIGDATGYVLEGNLKKSWEKTARLILSCREVVQVSGSTSRGERASQYVCEYLMDGDGELPADDANWRELCEAGNSFLYEGTAYLFADPFWKYLRLARDCQWSRDQVGSYLREAGCQPRRFEFRVNSRRCIRTAWRVPQRVLDGPMPDDGDTDVIVEDE